MRTSELPELFGIIRSSHFREPCVQLCSAEHVLPGSHRSREGLDYHIVQNVRNRDDTRRHFDFEMIYNNIHRPLLLIRYKHPITDQLQEVYCWFLPFRAIYNGYSVPILDFQYRSWLPTNYVSFPIGYDLNTVIRTMEDIQQDKLREIQQMEDNEAVPSIPWGDYIRTPSIRSTPNERYSIGRSLSRRMDPFPPRIRTPSPPPQQPVRIVEVQVPVDRVVVQMRVQQLPKAVGDILLANARQGSESCPILAVPFKECEKISITSCFHIFDSESLIRWRADHTSCPVCRSKIENVVSEE
jgi:hypothetical protein